MAESRKTQRDTQKDTEGGPETQAAGGSRVVRLHHLRPAAGSRKARTRVGRGEGSKGKTAGRGTKGTKARYQVRPGFEGGQMPLHMRLPKLRGFRSPHRVEYQPVNVGRIAELFPAGGTVTVEDLVAVGAVRKGHLVKVLGGGDVTVALTVTVDAWSGSAKEKIEAAGGSITTR
ncbi:50S ribosomal protein L15 [Actinomyces sp. 2119]|uniref:Large ribosomal subunit protein uL15 n=1 Tax=Actinomyces lilanjuaniae TaxID=2321394 RepID=A0ABN5PM62_9ACTO|nr:MULTISPECIES: 50S ribosomal protein L15 [Actinomyces]AYD89324.1 50S ribosomal protein L15 [Actinomyces lilanjuaniae]RJF40745.1 50S ribosomal protein L15 [Actinomyces sp. 2119]